MISRSDAVEEEVEVLEKRLADVALRQRIFLGLFVWAEGIAGFFAGIGGIIGLDVIGVTTFWNMIVGFDVVNGTVI